MSDIQARPNAEGAFALEVLSRDEAFTLGTYQAFIAGVKGYWRSDLYSRVKARAGGLTNVPIEDIEREMSSHPDYFLYSWLERRLQQFKYSGRWGLEAMALAHEAEIDRLLPLDGRPDIPVEQLPTYVRDPDIHQHPKGLWSAAANVVAHEWYQTGASFSGVSSDVVVQHHIGKLLPLVPHIGKILDLACTLGRVSIALKRALPKAEIVGVDVCEPAVRMSRAKAKARGLEIEFRQADGEALPFADGTFDGVSAHWLFHELPKQSISNVLDELRRVLKPGGALVICDMVHIPGGRLAQWFHVGHAHRNNEPYAIGLSELDFKVALESHGFRGVEMSDFNPEDRSTEWVEELPEKRTHYMTMVVATRA